MPECIRLVVPHAEVGRKALGVGLRCAAFVGCSHRPSLSPSSGPVARARIICSSKFSKPYGKIPLTFRSSRSSATGRERDRDPEPEALRRLRGALLAGGASEARESKKSQSLGLRFRALLVEEASEAQLVLS